MIEFIKKQPPVRIIAFGFLAVILLGSLLLIMPFSVRDGVKLSYVDALYMSTSAVCVTGLSTVDAGSTFTTFGQVVMLLLIQVGGLGVATIGAGLILMVGKKIDLKGISIVKEASNVESSQGIVRFVINIFIATLVMEFVGAVLSFVSFVRYMPPLQAVWVSIFHSVATFNNSGFDILGGVEGFAPGTSLMAFQNDVMLNVTTMLLIILGGIGFVVISEVLRKKIRWKKFSMHTKVVLTMSLALIVVGTLLIKFTQKDVSWLGALFFSVSSRTAGFATYNVGNFSMATLLVVIVLMFIGASPGSTGGGIKTTTLFAVMQGVKSSSSNKAEQAFCYSMPKDAYKKASVITFLAVSVVLVATLLISVLEPALSFRDVLFEVVSAFGTVGLSTGVTSSLSTLSKIVFMVVMFIGRLGPLTIASLWYFDSGKSYFYPEGNISIG